MIISWAVCWSSRIIASSSSFAACALIATPALAAAPSVGMFGSFYPSWLICLFAAVVATLILRVLFIVVRIDDILQWRVPVYMSMVLSFTYLFSFYFFGR